MGNNEEQHRATHLPILSQDAGQPVVTCDGCGMCCTEVSVPPYLDEIDFIPRELEREVVAARLIEDQLIADNRPCIWWDPQTKKCRHHEDRPNVCREYDVGGELCLETRVKYGVTAQRP